MTWWKEAVIYQIYPRSFYDSNGDGIGDLQGIIEKLDYLKGTPESLGVDAIWISPIFPSPMVDGGYDIEDYEDIHPMFGSLDTFITLVKEAHKRDIKIILDLVVNHTSDKHPWFIESKSSRDSKKRDWYIWKDPVNGREPNGWLSALGGKAWEFDKKTGQYYYHCFTKEQVDLNWRNPEVKVAIFKIIKFWLDLGVDGFRLDVVNYFVKDDEFRENPTSFFKGLRPYDRQFHIYDRNRPENHEIMKEMRKLVDSYEGDRMLLGEVYHEKPGLVQLAASYYGQNSDELHLSFDFTFLYCNWDTRKFINAIRNYEKYLKSSDWPVYTLSNHDQVRHISRYAKSYKDIIYKARLMAILLLTLRGTPVLYYGEEIGMLNEKLPRKKIQDIAGKIYWPFFNGRDGSRRPMSWDDSPNAGFSTGNSWLPISKYYKEINQKIQSTKPRSLFTMYKKLITIRKKYPSLQIGDMELLDNHPDDQILSYFRFIGKERLIILINFANHDGKFILENRPIPLNRGRVIFSTHKKEDSNIEVAIINLYPFEGTIIKLE